MAEPYAPRTRRKASAFVLMPGSTASTTEGVAAYVASNWVIRAGLNCEEPAIASSTAVSPRAATPGCEAHTGNVVEPATMST